MSENKKPEIHLDEIRQVLFFKEFEARPFTLLELVEKINSIYLDHEPVDVRVVDAYLDQISRAGIVEKHGRNWHINKPDFSVCPCCGK